ncbi:MAG: PD-(D/E)XK nuclease family protein [Candidatus Woesearchaeota archaeon]|jgi:CRISPR/Cas system-associated exonuclease Cas4 (RecB family)
MSYDITDLIFGNDKGQIYTGIIEEAIIKHNAWRQQERLKNYKLENAFHASGIGNICDRALLYQFLKRPSERKQTTQSLRRLDNGTYLHLRYDEYIKFSENHVVSNLHMYDEEYCIQGSFDQIILDKEELYIVDLKSIKDDDFVKISGNAPEGYYAQLQTYMWLMNLNCVQWQNKDKKFEEDDIEIKKLAKMFEKYSKYFPITKAILFFEDKDNQLTEEIRVILDVEFIENLKARLKNIKKCYDNKVLTQKNVNDKCKWCNYKKRCGGDIL